MWFRHNPSSISGIYILYYILLYMSTLFVSVVLKNAKWINLELEAIAYI